MNVFARTLAGFATLRIGTRLGLAFAALLTLAALLGGAALLQLTQVNATSHELHASGCPAWATPAPRAPRC